MVMLWQVSRRPRMGLAMRGSLPSSPGPSLQPVRLQGIGLLHFGVGGDEGERVDGAVFDVALHLEAIRQQGLNHVGKHVEVDAAACRRGR